MRKKIIFRQLFAKIESIADIRRNDTVFTQTKEKKTAIFKLSVEKNHGFYRFSTKWWHIFGKNRAFKINQLKEIS